MKDLPAMLGTYLVCHAETGLALDVVLVHEAAQRLMTGLADKARLGPGWPPGIDVTASTAVLERVHACVPLAGWDPAGSDPAATENSRQTDDLATGTCASITRLLAGRSSDAAGLANEMVERVAAPLPSGCRDRTPATGSAWGFLGGLAGIGYTLLRVAEPELELPDDTTWS